MGAPTMRPTRAPTIEPTHSPTLQSMNDPMSDPIMDSIAKTSDLIFVMVILYFVIWFLDKIFFEKRSILPSNYGAISNEGEREETELMPLFWYLIIFMRIGAMVTCA